MSVSKWIERQKRIKRKRKRYDIIFAIRGFELDVLKAALKAYAETAAKKEKAIAEELFGLIEYQENKQNKEN